MKNINLIFNVVLTMAVAVLFALYFSKNEPQTTPAAALGSVPDGMRIAYFNSDSVRENYKLFADEKVKMEAEMKQAQSRLVSEQKKFEADVAEFQQRAEFLTITERESREKKLGQKYEEVVKKAFTLRKSWGKKCIFQLFSTFGDFARFLINWEKVQTHSHCCLLSTLGCLLSPLLSPLTSVIS